MKQLLPLVLITIIFYSAVIWYGQYLKLHYPKTILSDIPVELIVHNGSQNLTKQDCCIYTSTYMEIGDEIQNYLTVENRSKDIFPEVKIAYQLKSYYDLISNSIQIQEGDRTISIDNDDLVNKGLVLGDIMPGQSKTVLLKLKVKEGKGDLNEIRLFTANKEYCKIQTNWPQLIPKETERKEYRQYSENCQSGQFLEQRLEEHLKPYKSQRNLFSLLALGGSALLLIGGLLYFFKLYQGSTFAVVGYIWGTIFTIFLTAIAIVENSIDTGSYEGLIGIMAFIFFSIIIGIITSIFIVRKSSLKDNSR